MQATAKTGKKVMNIVSIAGILGTLAVTIYFIKLGVFSKPEMLQEMVGNNKILGPIIFVLIQILQVVVPIIPGGVSNAAGVMMFGAYTGFLYNFIGNVIGSIILFQLGRKYGRAFVGTLVSDKTYDKYVGKLHNSKKWDVFFTLMMLSPVAPDDALVLMNSLTKMDMKKFIAIICVGKAVSIAAYSYLLIYGGQWIASFL